MFFNDAPRPKRSIRRLLAELAYHDIEVALAKNFHIVAADKLYRSAQPNRQQFIEMEKHGCKSVLNLRSHHGDMPIISGLELKEFWLKTHRMTPEDVKKALEIIRDAPMPMLIHSCHGTDRTGVVVAAYRIVFENIPPSEALREFRDRANGHHRYRYRHFPRLIRRIDWEALKREILTPESGTDAAAPEAPAPEAPAPEA
ncbi:MAG: tyrosine-protein phosphatase [Victivallaceae bacterium]|nr:tyrosine-protein phosphatase [Victivallaceae bacterium]